MKALRARLTITQRGDEGIGIIEVIVALGIFMIVSIGIAYTAVSSLSLASDSEAREVATNLAASEIDNARSTKDPLKLFDNTRTETVGGVKYTITREAGWVSATGTSSGCGTGTGALQYKQVDVTVTWPGKLDRTAPVRSNTLIAPVTRLNDPSFGTILVSVLAAAGTGSSGIPVTVTRNPAGGAAITVQPTDYDGCSYAFKVAPGTYTVAIKRSNFIDSQQVTEPTKSVTVVAGGIGSAAFAYDERATFNLNYASNASSISNKLFPSNLDTTFISTYGLYQKKDGTVSPVYYYPYSSGYAAIAGNYVAPLPANPPAAAIPGCVSPDPGSWPEGTVGGIALAAGIDTPSVAAGPGKSSPIDIPMGVVSLKYTGATDRTFVAKTVAPPAGSGDPGCDVPMTYTFSTKLKNGDTYKLALPFGSWSLSTASGTSALVPVVDPLIGGPLLGGLLGNPGATAKVFTLDPRVAK